MAGVFGVQRDGDAQQVPAQRREWLTGGDERAQQLGHGPGGDVGAVFPRPGGGAGKDGRDAGRGGVAGGQRGPEGPAFPQGRDQGGVAVGAGDDGLGSMWADTARVGMRIPARSNRKPIWPGGAAGSGGSALGGGTWS